MGGAEGRENIDQDILHTYNFMFPRRDRKQFMLFKLSIFLNPPYICIHMWRPEVGTGCLPQLLSKLFSETGKSVVEARVHLFC